MRYKNMIKINRPLSPPNVSCFTICPVKTHLWWRYFELRKKNWHFSCIPCSISVAGDIFYPFIYSILCLSSICFRLVEHTFFLLPVTTNIRYRDDRMSLKCQCARQKQMKSICSELLCQQSIWWWHCVHSRHKSDHFWNTNKKNGIPNCRS